MKIIKLFVICVLFLCSNYCAAETIKAEGNVVATIIMIETVEFNDVTNNKAEETPYSIVYTENGATLQVVF